MTHIYQTSRWYKYFSKRKDKKQVEKDEIIKVTEAIDSRIKKVQIHEEFYS